MLKNTHRLIRCCYRPFFRCNDVKSVENITLQNYGISQSLMDLLQCKFCLYFKMFLLYIVDTNHIHTKVLLTCIFDMITYQLVRCDIRCVWLNHLEIRYFIPLRKYDIFDVVHYGIGIMFSFIRQTIAFNIQFSYVLIACFCRLIMWYKTTRKNA